MDKIEYLIIFNLCEKILNYIRCEMKRVYV